MEISQKNDVFFIAGRLDEFADFAPLAAAAAPLKLNIGRITSINSVGVRKFLAFTLAWSPKVFEFYDCTPEFIANVNVIPQMLGKSADETQIKTFYVPFSCENCKRVENILFDRSSISKDDDGEVVLGSRKCSKCGEPLDLDVEKNEFFMFLSGT